MEDSLMLPEWITGYGTQGSLLLSKEGVSIAPYLDSSALLVSQDVIGYDRQLEEKLVRIELARGEALHAHVAFDFAMELFRFAVGVVEETGAVRWLARVCDTHLHNVWLISARAS